MITQSPIMVSMEFGRDAGPSSCCWRRRSCSPNEQAGSPRVGATRGDPALLPPQTRAPPEEKCGPEPSPERIAISKIRDWARNPMDLGFPQKVYLKKRYVVASNVNLGKQTAYGALAIAVVF